MLTLRPPAPALADTSLTAAPGQLNPSSAPAQLQVQGYVSLRDYRMWLGRCPSYNGAIISAEGQETAPRLEGQAEQVCLTQDVTPTPQGVEVPADRVPSSETGTPRP